MSEYAWKTGHGVADGSLVSIETDLSAYLDGIPFAIRSQPLNRYPVRTVLASGKERGDGRVDHVWLIPRLSRSAMEYIQDTYLNGGSDLSAAITIRTRLHDLDEWKRYNAYLCLCVPGEDYEYALGEFIDVRLRFRRLVAL